MARMGRPPKPAINRFWERVNTTANGCWEWTGYLDRDGYGQIVIGGRGGKPVRAHRWSYEHFVGPIPEGLVLDHTCRIRKCVNPDHLEPVTSRENSLRSPIAPAAMNAKKTHCPQGHPYSGPNLAAYSGGRVRVCKTCKAAYDARRNTRKAS